MMTLTRRDTCACNLAASGPGGGSRWCSDPHPTFVYLHQVHVKHNAASRLHASNCDRQDCKVRAHWVGGNLPVVGSYLMQ